VCGARTRVRSFSENVGGPPEWEQLGLERQLGLPVAERTVATWLLASGRAQTTPEYLLRAPIFLGPVFSRCHPRFREAFADTAGRIGMDPAWVGRSWAGLATVCAITGKAPTAVTTAQMVDIRKTFLASTRQDQQQRGYLVSMGISRAQLVLFHHGQLADAPRKLGTPPAPEGGWVGVTPQISVTLRRYLDRLALVRRPATVAQEASVLRQFGRYLTVQAPEVHGLSDLTRAHLEAYRAWLAVQPARGGAPAVTRNTQGKRLAILRGCFERIAEWEWDDAPRSRLILRDDFPVPDRPLPRFLDDAVAARLLVSARAAPAPFDRIAIEILARTGLRVGEFLDLTVDAVVQIGSGYWLRVPLGKLHNDRYVPLHPQLKQLIDEWVAARPTGLTGKWLWMQNGRRITRARVSAALNRATDTAGRDHVTPHQLRHTLATQAINRGMSLEALAALLGHKNLSMTLVYARIADRTVADEYFRVTQQVEALYDQPAELPAALEGTEMRKLRGEMHRRMLGNGYCARPVELDCHFESICESCTFFVTTIAFRPTLTAQRDDAAAKGQAGRQKVFDGILRRLDDPA